MHIVCEILSYFTTTGLKYFTAFFALIAAHLTSPKCLCAQKKTKLKIKNLKFIMCISFNKVRYT